MANIKRNGNFTTVTNEFIRSTSISFKAKGIYAYMASFTSDWNFTIKSMSTQTGEGVASIRTAMKELKDSGYLEYEKHQDGTGTYLLNDSPKVEKPNVDNRIMRKSHRIKKTNPSKKNNTYKASVYEDFLTQLKASCKFKTKVTKTKDGEKIFKEIEDKGKLFTDYIAHQEEKKEYSVRITAYMEDYNTVHNKQKEEVQTKW